MNLHVLKFLLKKISMHVPEKVDFWLVPFQYIDQVGMYSTYKYIVYFHYFIVLLTAGTIPEHKELCITDRVTGMYMTKSTKNAPRRKVTRRRHRFRFRSSSLSSLITDLYKHEERK